MSQASTSERPHRILLAGFPPAQMLDISGPLDVFTIANELSEAKACPAPYHISLAGPAAGALMTTSGVPLQAEFSLFDTTLKPDTLLICGGRGARMSSRDPRLVGALAALCERAHRVGSICTGAFPLAATGALDGHHATTHWAHFDEFSNQFPQVEIDRDALFLSAGKCHTSAGITAGIDFCLSLVERDLGRALALQVAQELVVFMKRPGGQSQFSTLLMHDATGADKAPFDALVRWMGEHLHEDLSVDVLAGRVAMSPRHFARRFSLALKTAPGKYVQMLRLDAARRMLTESTLSVKQIADRCGFQSVETMRIAFQRSLNTSPSDFRARFQSSEHPGP